MTWALTAGRRLMGGHKSTSSPRQPGHHYQHHHHNHRGLLSSGGACPPVFWPRRRTYLLGLVGVLVGVLVVNMLLLAPHLHTSDPSSNSDSSTGLSTAAVRQGSAAGSDVGTGPAAAAAAAIASVGSRQQQQQQRRRQQQLVAPRVDLLHDFDANQDGVLGPPEFQALMQEVCRAERASLGLFASLIRLLRLAFGLRPRYISTGGELYPCSLGGELRDATSQAAAALSGGFRGSSSGTGSSSSRGSGRRRGSKQRGSRGDVWAANAAGAATVDPDSPEGRALSRRASLLSGCSPLTPELAAAAAPHGTLMLVAADWGMFELFGINWLMHVQRSGLDNYLMAAMDQKTADFLVRHKLGRCISWNPQLPDGGAAAGGQQQQQQQLPPYTPPAASAGSRQHAVLSWVVLQAAQVLLHWEYDVIISHLDTVWLTDPQPYLTAHLPAAADLVLASDAPATAALMATRSAGLIPHPEPNTPVSLGGSFIRGTPQGAAAVTAWLAAHAAQLQAADAAAAASGSAVNSSSPLLLPSDVIGAWLAGSSIFSSSSSSSRGRLQQQYRAVSGSVEPHPSDPKQLLLVGPQLGLWGRWFGSTRSRLRRGVGVGLFSPVAVSNSYSWFVQGVGWRSAAVVARSSSSAASGRKLPLAVHVGGGHSSREGRLHEMREAQWYADGPRYYSEPKLLSFSLRPYSSPEVDAGLANAPDFSQGAQLALHLASLHHQLKQFYAGAAVAAALGRVMLLPTFQCYCYRDPEGGLGGPGRLGWGSGPGSSSSSSHGGGWSCRAPGDDNSVLPFNCTMDQVFDPSVLYGHSPLFGGHPLLFRESPFLDNPRSPSWIRHAATSISSGAPAGCPEDGSPCAQVLATRPPKGVNQQVVIPPGLTDASLTEVLAPFAAAKWLHFTDIAAVFGGFAAPSHKAEYEAWLDKAVLPWCCKPAGDDGSSGSSSEGGGGGDGDGTDSSAAATAADAFAAGGSSPLQGVVELATAAEGWVMVEVKAHSSEPTTQHAATVKL